MKLTIFILSIVIMFASCSSTKMPARHITFKGVIKTCILDSTSLTKEINVKIINAPNFVNSDCNNKPKSYDYPLTWPSGIYLDFKTKKYVFQYSPIPLDKNIDFANSNFKMSWNADLGKIKYNPKNNTLTLTSSKFKWTRTFTVFFSDNNTILSLTAIN